MVEHSAQDEAPALTQGSPGLRYRIIRYSNGDRLVVRLPGSVHPASHCRRSMPDPNIRMVREVIERRGPFPVGGDYRRGPLPVERLYESTFEHMRRKLADASNGGFNNDVRGRSLTKIVHGPSNALLSPAERRPDQLQPCAPARRAFQMGCDCLPTGESCRKHGDDQGDDRHGVCPCLHLHSIPDIPAL